MDRMASNRTSLHANIHFLGKPRNRRRFTKAFDWPALNTGRGFPLNTMLAACNINRPTRFKLLRQSRVFYFLIQLTSSDGQPVKLRQKF